MRSGRANWEAGTAAVTIGGVPNNQTDKGKRDDDGKATDESSPRSKDDSEEKNQSTSEHGKDPEPPGNLRRRGEWFQKRHGRN